jgi:hypothetical protein
LALEKASYLTLFYSWISVDTKLEFFDPFRIYEENKLHATGD